MQTTTNPTNQNTSNAAPVPQHQGTMNLNGKRVGITVLQGTLILGAIGLAVLGGLAIFNVPVITNIFNQNIGMLITILGVASGGVYYFGHDVFEELKKERPQTEVLDIQKEKNELLQKINNLDANKKANLRNTMEHTLTDQGINYDGTINLEALYAKYTKIFEGKEDQQQILAIQALSKIINQIELNAKLESNVFKQRIKQLNDSNQKELKEWMCKEIKTTEENSTTNDDEFSTLYLNYMKAGKSFKKLLQQITLIKEKNELNEDQKKELTGWEEQNPPKPNLPYELYCGMLLTKIQTLKKQPTAENQQTSTLPAEQPPRTQTPSAVAAADNEDDSLPANPESRSPPSTTPGVTSRAPTPSFNERITSQLETIKTQFGIDIELKPDVTIKTEEELNKLISSIEGIKDYLKEGALTFITQYPDRRRHGPILENERAKFKNEFSHPRTDALKF